MGTRRNSRRRIRWAFWLVIGIVLWLAGAFFVTSYLDGRGGAAGKQECIVSCVYLIVLLLVMAVGNFARVRVLLTLEILYGIAVIFRAAIGTLTALLFIEQPMEDKWGNFFDALVRPLAGLEYVAAQLTSHFITEIYWLGLGLTAAILVFLSCVAIMAVGSRIGREREREQRRRQTMSAAAQRTADRRRTAGTGGRELASREKTGQR